MLPDDRERLKFVSADGKMRDRQRCRIEQRLARVLGKPRFARRWQTVAEGVNMLSDGLRYFIACQSTQSGETRSNGRSVIDGGIHACTTCEVPHGTAQTLCILGTLDIGSFKSFQHQHGGFVPLQQSFEPCKQSRPPARSRARNTPIDW